MANLSNLLAGQTNLVTDQDLAAVATTGSYTDLTNKPTIPTVPTLATVATTGSYTDLINKPVVATLKVSSIAYPGDDLAANPVGGQTITLTGTGFTAGLSVLVNTTMAAVVTVVSATTVTFTAPAMAAGTYVLYLVATDGSVALSLPGISYSGVPTWSTGAGTLGSHYETSAISKSLLATSTDGAVTYSLVSGALPPGSTLNTSTGAISGTAPATNSSTTYNFTIRATDAQNQDTDRSFSITLNPDSISWSSPSTDITVTADIGTAYAQALAATSAAGNSVSYSSDQLPTGIAVSGSNLTGTLTAEGIVTSIITATAANSSRTATRTITFNIASGAEPYFKNVSLLLTGNGTFPESKTYTVTNSGASDYLIDGVGDPTLTLIRGSTYTFNVNATGHPFWIKTVAVTGTASSYDTGVTNNGTQSGTVTFVVPSDAPSTLYYICQFHGSMVGTINIVNAAINNNTFLDGSTNNFTITRNGNATQGSFSPYGSNWSNYFDGSSAYLSVPDNSAFSFGSGAFTIEAWINMADVTPSKAEWIVCQWLSDSNNSWGLRFETNGTLNFYWSLAGNDATTIGVSSPNIAANTWAHIAVVRNSNTLTIYVNGTSAASGTLSGTLYDSTTTVRIGIQANTSFNQYYTGYISNLRIVKGTAVYTSSFTPSTTPLTAITNTSLLTCQSNRFIDNSTNTYAITVDGTPSVQRFNPFGTATAYSTSVIGGSGYFDGSGDRVYTPTTSALNITGDFTIECWIYRTAEGSSYPMVMICSQGSISAETGIVFNFPSPGVNFSWGDGGITGGSIPFNEWNHIAVTRNLGITRIFVNGVQKASTATSYTFATGYPWYLGDRPAGASGANYPFAGYISDARMIKNQAIYTANFTPPTAPLTAVTNTQLLINFTNAGIIDSAMINDLETVGNAQISTSVKKYGAGSLAFDGTGDYLSTRSNPNLAFGSGNFTIECWVYANALGSYNAVFAQWPENGGSANNSYVLESVGSDMNFYVCSGTTVYGPATLGTITTGSWIHYAVCRSGSTLYPFKNGVLGTTIAITETLNSPTSNVTIGGAVAGGGDWNGYIDDLRVTKGYARYTANFTPPTSGFKDK